VRARAPSAPGLGNLALLCQYHHTWVHQRDLTATITTFDVTWQT